MQVFLFLLVLLINKLKAANYSIYKQMNHKVNI
jgi:hypothetical protein